MEEPLGLLLRPGVRVSPAAAAHRVARLLSSEDLGPGLASPPWLAPHQRRAVKRLLGMLCRHGGALLADAAGLGKSWIALGVAATLGTPFALIVPAVLRHQWRTLLDRLRLGAEILTHEALSSPFFSQSALLPPLVIVDEAHRFRSPHTRRYDRLARLVVGRKVLLVTATPIHNRVADVLHLIRLFARDDAFAALGVSSLAQATREPATSDAVLEAVGRVVVARSRGQVAGEPAAGWVAGFPARAGAATVREPAVAPELLPSLLRALRRLEFPEAAGAGAILRLALLRRLASSLPAFRETLHRHRDFLAEAREAAAAGRRLSRAEFQRLFPRDLGPDLQLALLPLLLDAVAGALPETGWSLATAALDQLLSAPLGDRDPKLDRLGIVLAAAPRRTIVFTDAEATVRYLLRHLAGRFRTAGVVGRWGLIGRERVARQEVLAAFAPLAQGTPAPPAARRVDVLVATDLLSEGLNLQDADQVVHYDLPWTPARLAQRVGRIDRLGSPHAEIRVVSFLPPAEIERELEAERRLIEKARAERRFGTPDVELPGARLERGALDWADTVAAIAERAPTPDGGSCWTLARAAAPGALAIVSFARGEDTHYAALVLDPDGHPHAAPRQFAAALAEAVAAEPADDVAPTTAIAEVVDRITPFVRARLAALREARWRAPGSHRPGRRLVPWVMAAARRAARQGDSRRLAALEGLLVRLSAGMTAGEERLLDDLLRRRTPAPLDDLLAWSDGLPLVAPPDAPIATGLEAVIILTPPCSSASSPISSSPSTSPSSSS